MKKYLRIMRFDHWIKQFFIVPGCVCALMLTGETIKDDVVIKFVLGFLSTCIIASANYIINEYLDAEFDKYHPTKKYRSVVSEDVKGSIVWTLWIIFTIVGLLIALLVNIPLLITESILWVMGILYNVKPLRTKDIAILDVLSESINNALRLLIGWFIVSSTTFPPSSLVIGYWMAGAFLMATKRFSEYRMIGDPKVAGLYRKSFKYYSEKSLLISSFFYAMCSVFCIGVFLIKYRIELLLLMPVLMGLFCYYFYISFKDDSAAQKPEKLYKEKGLMLYVAILIIIFALLMIIDIPSLSKFVSDEIISI